MTGNPTMAPSLAGFQRKWLGGSVMACSPVASHARRDANRKAAKTISGTSVIVHVRTLRTTPPSRPEAIPAATSDAKTQGNPAGPLTMSIRDTATTVANVAKGRNDGLSVTWMTPSIDRSVKRLFRASISALRPG